MADRRSRDAVGGDTAGHRLTLVLGVCMLIVITVAHRELVRHNQALGVEPLGYRSLVNRTLAGRIALERREPPTTSAVTITSEDGEPIDLLPEGGAERIVPIGDWSQAEMEFRAWSFLFDDMRFPDRFVSLSDGDLRLRPGFRRRPLPFSESGIWRGRITFRNRRRTTVLRSRLTGRELRFVLPPGGAATGGRSERLAVGDTTGTEPVLTASQYTWTDGIETAFALRAIPTPGGEIGVVMTAPGAHTGARLYHNGDLVPITGPQGSVLQGDHIEYRRGSLAERFRLLRTDTGVISEYRQGREGFERVYFGSHGLDWIARSAAASMNRLVRYLEEARAQNFAQPAGAARRAAERLAGAVGSLRDRELQLTIDPGMQAAATRVLARAIHDEMPSEGWSMDGLARLSPRAAITILDVGSGELLAAASYPSEEQFDQSIVAMDSEDGSIDSAVREYLAQEAARRREQFTRNHVFDPHQIGSTAKPLLGAAIALHAGDDGIDPLALQVDCAALGAPRVPSACQGDTKSARAPPAGRVARTRLLPYDCVDKSHGPDVDYRRFIAESCNAYLSRLGEVALASTPGFEPADCEGSLGDRLRAWSGRWPESPGDVAQLNPLARYAWLAGGWTNISETSGEWLRNDSWWLPLSAEIESVVETELGCKLRSAVTFGGISPPLVNLDVLSLACCDPHFTSFLVGGGSNRWSNADIALAYARLASGRSLAGKILIDGERDSDRNGGRGPFSEHECRHSLGCDDPDRYEEVRRETLAGMSLALKPPGGTAQKLHKTMKRLIAELGGLSGRQWGAYAKTGTVGREVELVKSIDPSTGKPRYETVRLPVANFTLLLLEGEDGPEGKRELSLACRSLPPLGEELRGYVIHVWVSGVQAIRYGSRAGALLNQREGGWLLDRLVDHVGGDA